MLKNSSSSNHSILQKGSLIILWTCIKSLWCRLRLRLLTLSTVVTSSRRDNINFFARNWNAMIVLWLFEKYTNAKLRWKPYLNVYKSIRIFMVFLITINIHAIHSITTWDARKVNTIRYECVSLFSYLQWPEFLKGPKAAYGRH